MIEESIKSTSTSMSLSYSEARMSLIRVVSKEIAKSETPGFGFQMLKCKRFLPHTKWFYCLSLSYSEGRPSLIRARPERDNMRPITILSLEETPSGSGQLRGSHSNLHTGEDTGRTSRSSRLSRESHGTRQSMSKMSMEIESQHTRGSLQEMEA